MKQRQFCRSERTPYSGDCFTQSGTLCQGQSQHKETNNRKEPGGGTVKCSPSPQSIHAARASVSSYEPEDSWRRGRTAVQGAGRLDCNGTAEITAEAETDTENKQNYVFFAPKEIHTEGPA